MFHASPSIDPVDARPTSQRHVPTFEAALDRVRAGELPGRQRCVLESHAPESTASPVAGIGPGPDTGTRLGTSVTPRPLATRPGEAPRLPRTSRLIAALASVVVATSLVSGIAAGMLFEDGGLPAVGAPSLAA